MIRRRPRSATGAALAMRQTTDLRNDRSRHWARPYGHTAFHGGLQGMTSRVLGAFRPGARLALRPQLLDDPVLDLRRHIHQLACRVVRRGQPDGHTLAARRLERSPQSRRSARPGSLSHRGLGAAARIKISPDDRQGFEDPCVNHGASVSHAPHDLLTRCLFAGFGQPSSVDRVGRGSPGLRPHAGAARNGRHEHGQPRVRRERFTRQTSAPFGSSPARARGRTVRSHPSTAPRSAPAVL